MRKRIPIGIEFYQEMIQGNYYYADKTLLIKALLDSGTKVTLFTRPRRFGKTLAMSMLKTFFEDERDKTGERIDNCYLFDGMKISACGDGYLTQMGQYPVISLSLKSAKQPDFQTAYEVLQMEIRGEFRRHHYVCGAGILKADVERQFERIEQGQATAAQYATALRFLSECLKEYHKRDVVILIDEYDVPLENSYFEGFYDKMVTFLRSLFESALKTNICLKLGVVTGCLRISKESIFTGLNNLKVASILNDDFSEYFGFSQEEAYSMLEAYGLEGKKPELKKWYDGYQFGKTEVYNPWSVINYVDAAVVNTNAFPKPYWANTSSNSIVRELVEAADLGTKGEIEGLLAGGTIEKPIHEDITYGDIHKSQDNLWNFLFFTGYLKMTGQKFLEDTIYLEMAIPNKEIRSIYQNTILDWFGRKVKGANREPLYQALLARDCDALEKFLKRQLVETISFYDAGEQFYHGFMAGMLWGLGDYTLKSNREAGDGRPDLMMVPADEEMPVIILELKKADTFSTMESQCHAALRQIEEKSYDAECRAEGYGHFIKYGICFCKKSCKVRAEAEPKGK